MARPTGTTSETGNNYNTSNGTGAQVRTKINEIFQSLRTISSGSGDPSGAANISQFQPHINTTTNELKIATSVSSDTAQYVILGKINEANFGHVVAATPTMTGNVSMNSNGFLKVPVGTDAQQPGAANQPAAAVGQLRYNSDQNRFEGYKNTGWGEIGGGAGATGGGTDQVFVETGQTVTTTYSLSAGKNAVTVSPTINNNVEVTVPSGATLVIL